MSDVKKRPIAESVNNDDWIVVQSDDAGLGNEKRAKLSSVLGISKDIDVCVIGATIGGIFAAIAARKKGLSVIICEEHPYHIGGMTSGGLSFQDIQTGNTDLSLYSPLTKDFYTRIANYYGVTVAQWATAKGAGEVFNPAQQNGAVEPKVAKMLLQQMLDENNVPVMMGAAPQTVVKNGLYIRSVQFTNGLIVNAKQWIDSSYHADLMIRTPGVSYTWGREANATYSETNNGQLPGAVSKLVAGKPDVSAYVTVGDPTSGTLPFVSVTTLVAGAGDRKMQAYNYRLVMTNDGTGITPWEPDYYNPLEYEHLGRLFAAGSISGRASILTPGPLQNSKQDFNANGPLGTDWINANHEQPLADYGARREFADKLKNYILGLFKFIREDSRVPLATKNDVAQWKFPLDEFQETNGFPPLVYVRESNRLVGDTVFNQNTFYSRSVRDIIAYGGYPIDSHVVQIVNNGGNLYKEGEYWNATLGRYYPIPYSIILPKQAECRNLLVTFGVSASHIAFGSLRIEWTHGGIGEAAGYAAALAIQQRKTLHELHPSYIQEAVNLAPFGILMDCSEILSGEMTSTGNASGSVTNGTITLTGPGTGFTIAKNQVGQDVFGPDFLHDGTQKSPNKKIVRFTPNLPAAGQYEVFIKWRHDPTNAANRANNVPVLIVANGATTEVTVNQKIPGTKTGKFESVGTYTFSAVGGGAEYVEIANANQAGVYTAGGTAVIYDAIVFQPKFNSGL